MKILQKLAWANNAKSVDLVTVTSS